MNKNYLEKLLSEQKIQTYLDCVWRGLSKKSKSFFHQRHNRLQPIIKAFANDTQLRQLMPYFDMDTMYFKPYIGSNYDFWLKQNKSVDYFLNEKNKGIAVCYKKSNLSNFTYKYKEKAFNIEHLEEIVREADKKGELDLVEMYIENGEYCLLDFDSTPFFLRNGSGSCRKI